MSKKQKKDLIQIGISTALFLIGLWIPSPPVSILFLLASYLLIGWRVLKEAIQGIAHGQLFDENFLMSIATIGAILIGEYHEAVAVMLFYQVGEWFQHYAVGKSRTSIAELMDIVPETAVVERNGAAEIVDPEEVEVGEILLIRAGERIPLDGVVLEGSSALNTSALTGESIPRDVTVGDEVISGCINQSGLLKVRATKLYTDSTVAQILDLVENATDKKAKVESFITRFARYYTPAVCGAALLLFLLPPLFLGGGWSEWGYRALSFLVVSCPCALVISVPLSFFGGIGGASRCGILMKGSNYLEALAKAEIVVFDKTGTLTKGAFSITEISPLQISREELLRLAALLESQSTHPISQCICAACEKGLDSSSLSEFQELPGKGVSARIDGILYRAGNAGWFASLGIPCPCVQSAGTVVCVAKEETCLGFLTVNDEVKQGSKAAIDAMKKIGVRQTVMLSGDNTKAAEWTAAQLGIDAVYAQLLPADKVAKVEELLQHKTSGATLVYVGDGINDAPVLTRSDVGIAMGALGSDAAVEAADIVLMDDDPRKIVAAIQISRRTMSIARQNIIFALGVKLLVLALVAIGVAGMWLAVFADVGVAVIAILNAIRAMKINL